MAIIKNIKINDIIKHFEFEIQDENENNHLVKVELTNNEFIVCYGIKDDVSMTKKLEKEIENKIKNYFQDVFHNKIKNKK